MLETHVVPLSPKHVCGLLRRSGDHGDSLACRNLHHYIISYGYLSDAYLPNYLIRSYACCHCLPDAQRVFDRLSDASVFSWSAIISAYAHHGMHEQAFGLYSEVLRSKVQPDGHVYTALLNVCKCEAHLAQGRMVHEHILHSPYKLDVYVNNTLIDMYARCGCLCTARHVFDVLPCRDIVTWNTLLAGHAHHKAWQDILVLFNKLHQAKHQPNQITFVCILKACANLHNLKCGMLCHFLIVEHGLECIVRINNVLIDVYAKCGSLQDVEELFVASPKQDVVTWTSIISGYVDYGAGEKAFKAYETMLARFFEPNEFTYASIIKSCSNSRSFVRGRLIHADIIERGFFQSMTLSNALIGMYSQCGSFHDAWQTFVQSWERDVVSWNSIISTCTEHGHTQLGLQLFKQLQQEGLQPDALTLAGAIRACSLLQNLHEGRVLHVHAIGSDWLWTTSINNNILHLYVSCSSLREARRVFDSMPMHVDVVAWNVMIGGYASCGWVEEAFKLFEQMQTAAVQANPITLVCMLKACSVTSALEKGRLLHISILRSGFVLDAYVGSILIHFYASCGSFADAQNVFSRLKEQGLVPWSAMLAAYAQQSNCKEAFMCFEKMQQQGLELDDVAYVSLLSACSHAGLLYKNGFPFQLDFGLMLVPKHYNCLADLLGRLGYLSQAKIVLQNMRFHLGMPNWISLLSHCRTYTNSKHTLDGMIHHCGMYMDPKYALDGAIGHC